MTMTNDQPIIIGLAGHAGVGKTSTAQSLAPSRIGYSNSLPDMVWNHTYLALPLYEMVKIKNDVKDIDRLLYNIHDVVYEMLQRSCRYDDLIELVYDIVHMDMKYTGEQSKPRDFLQQVGDMCRTLDENCFVQRAITSIRKDYLQESVNYERADVEPPIYFGIISDLRMKTDFDYIRKQPNNLMIKLKADQDVLDRRLLERDDAPLTSEQKKHRSESELDTISDDEFDIILDTTDLTLKEQVTWLKTEIVSEVFSMGANK